jgi:hypothetical protein
MTQLPPPPPGFEGRNQPPTVPPAQAEAVPSDLPVPPSTQPLPPPPAGFEGREQPPTAGSGRIESETQSAGPQPVHSTPDPETDQQDSAGSSSRARQLVVLLLVVVVSVAATLVISSALSDTDDDTAAIGEAVDDSGDEMTAAGASSSTADPTDQPEASADESGSGATDPTPTTTQPPEPEPYDGPVWDDTVVGPVNAQNLAFTDVENAAPRMVDAVAKIKSNMSDTSRPFRDDYWASYIVLAATGCHALSQDYQRAIDENWSQSQVLGVLEGHIQGLGTYARENLVGMTYFTDKEVGEAYVASLFSGGCQGIFDELVIWAAGS